MRLVLLVISIVFVLVETRLQSFDEKTIYEFIERSERRNVTTKCQQSLSKIQKYMTDYDTLSVQKTFFADSFSIGESEQFVSSDQDRWVYRAHKCLIAAGEATYSRSEYPLHYCYGYNEAKEKLDGIAYGICIPSPCYGDRYTLLKEWQNLTSDNDVSRIDFSSCTKSRHEKQWYEKPIPFFEFLFNLSLYGLVIAATYYHIRRGEQTKSVMVQILLAFSLKKNFARLIHFPKDPKSTMTCMFGMRFLSMVWTLVGHSFLFVQAYLENVQEYKNDLVNNFFDQWITNFTLSVDTFFVLSATLTASNWFKQFNDKSKDAAPSWNSYGYWLRFYRHRIFRLWPAYLYTLFDVTLRVSVQYIHPMWPPTDPAVQCPVHWWENALFVNSLLENRCMPWTWYIGTEFIFYVLSPIFLITLHQTPKLGFAISILTIVASGGANVIGMMVYNFPPTQLLWKQPPIFNKDFIKHHVVMYIKPQYRIGPYIVGLLLGYVLAVISRNSDKLKHRVYEATIGWSLATLIGFWALFGLYPSLQGWDWPIYHYIYGASHRTLWALSMAWIIYACHTGIGGVINKILSLKFLLPLSSLCYSVYLIHMILIVFTYLLVPFPMVYNGKLIILAHCFVQLVMSYFFGTIVAMLSELPALNIERIFTNAGLLRPPQMISSNRQQSKTAINDSEANSIRKTENK